MGIDKIEELKPPPHPDHDPSKCGGPGNCLPCSVETRAEMEVITEYSPSEFLLNHYPTKIKKAEGTPDT